MDINVSSSTVLVFTLYSGLIFYTIFFSSYLKTLITLLLILGLVTLAWALEPISHSSFPFITLLFLSAYCSIERQQTNPIFSNISICLLAILSLAFAVHIVPGFHNALVFSSNNFGASNLPFSLYANLDKALAAVAILIAFHKHIIWKVSIKDAKAIALCLLLFFSLCVLIGAKTDLKFGELTLAFIFFNLFVTCLAEEAFFRLLIQDKLAKYLPSKHAGLMSVFITATIFMAAHFHTGVDADKRLALIFIAGLLYGAIYLRSKSLGSAITMHFAVNIIHFSFFAYPATFSQ